MTPRELLPFVCILAGSLIAAAAWAADMGPAGAVCGFLLGAGWVWAVDRLLP